MATIQDKSEDQELEQYGVWVKAGPDDVDMLDPEESTESPSSDSGDSTNSLDDDFSLEDFSLDETSLDDSPDDFSIEEVRLDEESDSFDTDVFGGLDQETSDGENALTPEEEELLAPLEAHDSAPPDIDIDDIDFDTDLSALEDETADPDDELASANDDISSLGTLPGGASEHISLDDITIDDEEELPELESEVAGDQEADLDAIGDLEDFSVSAEYESDLPREDETDHIFDDVGAVTDEMSSIETADGQDDAMTEDTTAHLRTIESELSVIKSELFALRKELAGLRGGRARTTPRDPDDELVADDTDDADGGFFDDDEDETIALTGDELDNILNTAEFTDETPEPRSSEDAGSEEPAESGTSDVDGFDLQTLDDELESLDESLEQQTDFASVAANDDVEIIGDDITGHDEETIPESPDQHGDLERAEAFGDEIELSDDDLLPTELYETADDSEASTAVETSISGDEPSDIEDELDIEALDFDESLDSFDDELDIASLDTVGEEPSAERIAALDTATPVYEETPAADDEQPIEEIVLEDLDDEEVPAADVVTDEWEIGDETGQAGEIEESSSEAPKFGPSDDEVTALAEMDIDSELAGIDELTDDTEDIQPDISDIGDIELDLEPTSDDEFQPDQPDQPVAAEPAAERRHAVESQLSSLPEDLKNEIRAVLTYMDQLLEALPEEKIEEFARSEHFEVYKRLFEELGLEG